MSFCRRISSVEVTVPGGLSRTRLSASAPCGSVSERQRYDRGPAHTFMAAAAYNYSRRHSKQLILSPTSRNIQGYAHINVLTREDHATPSATRTFQASRNKVKNMSGPLAATFRWLQRKRYQYEVTFSLYMLTPTEKFIFSETLLVKAVQRALVEMQSFKRTC